MKTAVNIAEHFNSRKTVQQMQNNYSENGTTRIVFCGRFKNGKSSLVNAVLGTNLLPVKTTSATAAVTRIFFSEQLCAYGIFNGEKKEIQFDDRAEYITLKKKTLDNIEMPDATEVGIGVPYPLLRNVEIVDTPGLDDDDNLDRITFSEIRNADIAVIVYDAIQLLAEKEKITAKKINEMLDGNVVYAVNRVNQVTGNINDVMENVEFFLGKITADLKEKIFYVAADGKDKDVVEFSKWIHKTAKNQNLLSKIKESSRKAAIRYYISERKALLDNDITIIETELNELKAKNDEIRSSKLRSLKDRLRNIRRDISSQKSRIANGLGTESVMYQCTTAFELLKGKPDWSTNYSKNAKKAAKAIFNDYIKKEVAKLKKIDDFDLFKASECDLSNVFTNLTFPQGSITEYKSSEGLSYVVGIGAGLLTAIFAAPLAPIVAFGLKNAIGDTTSTSTSINNNCVQESIAYLKSTVIPKISDKLNEFFDILNNRINQYEGESTVTGSHEADISEMEKNFIELVLIQKYYEEIIFIKE